MAASESPLEFLVFFHHLKSTPTFLGVFFSHTQLVLVVVERGGKKKKKKEETQSNSTEETVKQEIKFKGIHVHPTLNMDITH